MASKEIALFTYGQFEVSIRPNLTSGWITGAYRSTSWIHYGNGRFGYDEPELVCETIRRKLAAMVVCPPDWLRTLAGATPGNFSS